MKTDEYYRFILKQAKQIIYDYDFLTKKIKWDGDIEGVTGFDKDYFKTIDLLGWENLIHPDDREKAINLLDEAIKKHEKYEITYRFKYKKGGYRFIEDCGSFLFDKNGKAYKMIGVMRDISKQKEIERKLKDSKEYFKALIENSTEVISILDENGNNLYDSKAFEKMLGHKIKGRVGKSSFDFVYHDDVKKVIKQFTELVAKPRAIENISFRIISKDKVIHHIEGVAQNLLESPIIKGIILNFHDVTERKKTEMEKLELQKKLNHSYKMDAIGQLSEGIAHDFNNMLSGVIGASELLKDNLKFDENIKLIDLIIDTSLRASDLTSKLLAFGRKDENFSKIIDVHKVIDDTKDILSKTIDKKISILFEKNAKNHDIKGSFSMLENIIMNIGINASHAMPNGGTLIIKTKNIVLNKDYCNNSSFNLKLGEYIEIKISDTGKGILPENIDKIFNPFFTTKKLGKGTGLGLSSVYGSVLSHNGAITVQSEPEKLTIFTILLPCSMDNYKEKITNNNKLKGKGNILLVDDEEIIRNIGKKILNKLGYSVLTAEDGEKAVNIYNEKHSEIDLVITDMTMPKMNGYETFVEMKKINKNCKVIMSSGFMKEDVVEELKKLGMLGFIEKPYGINKLSNILKDVMFIN